MTYFVELSDRRNILLYNKLKEKEDVQPFVFGENAGAHEGGILILSPARKLSEAEADAIPQGMTVIGGNLSDGVIGLLKRRGIMHISLSSDEAYIMQNARLTAEGALHLVISCTEKSIADNNILILGGGRVAKAVAILFSRLGIRVSVAARNKNEQAAALLYAQKVYGMDFASGLKDYDIIINTVPKQILDDSTLKAAADGAVIIELASLPCLDKTAVQNYPIRYLPAPALPSVYSAESAAEIMLKTVRRLLKDTITP